MIPLVPYATDAADTGGGIAGGGQARGSISRSIGASFESDFGPLTLPILCAGTRQDVTALAVQNTRRIRSDILSTR